MGNSWVHVGALVLVVALSLLIVTFAVEPFTRVTAKSEVRVEKSMYRMIHTLDSQTETEWLDVVRHGTIDRIIAEGFVGLAKKYLVIFESGHIGIAKLVTPLSYCNLYWRQSKELDAGPYSRSDRRYQAWPEVAANIVSRIAFPVARKPPAAIRTISSSVLYNCEGCNTWSDYFFSLLPEHEVTISVHSYMDQLNYAPPSTETMEYLTHSPHVHERMSPILQYSEKNVLLASDVILFDFLIDDHDRKKGHNWMSDGTGTVILWDSGLSFQHGPGGRESCKSLFCGPEKWIEHGKKMFNQKKCVPICRFRNETISRMRELHDAKLPHQTLGGQVKAEADSTGMPLFELNVYYQFPRLKFPRTTFPASMFYAGLNERLGKLLAHVDSCVTTHGAENVFM